MRKRGAPFRIHAFLDKFSKQNFKKVQFVFVCLLYVSFINLTVAVRLVHSTPVSAETTTLAYDWSQYIEPQSGIGVQIGDIKVATDGSVYAVGSIYGSADFDPKGAGDIRTVSPNAAAFITKRNSDGSYAWTRILESTTSVFLGAFREEVIKLDAANNIYLTG